MFHNSDERDQACMTQALVLAQQAFDEGEVPIGALVVDATGKIIGSGYNQIEKQQSQIAHAEISALRQAAHARGDWRLGGCTLYVTIEPCTMCYGALRLSRIDRLVFGASSPVFGYHLDKDSFLSVYNNDTLLIKEGIMKEECAKLVRRFFEQKRKQ